MTSLIHLREAPAKAYTGLPSGSGNAFTACVPRSTTASKKKPKKRGPKPTTCTEKTLFTLMSPEERKAAREAKLTAFHPRAGANFVGDQLGKADLASINSGAFQ